MISGLAVFSLRGAGVSHGSFLIAPFFDEFFSVAGAIVAVSPVWFWAFLF